MRVDYEGRLSSNPSVHEIGGKRKGKHVFALEPSADL
jgi:hypothetical protein